MPRRARIVVPGVPHHVVSRGNNQQDVFFVDDDHRVYLKFLREDAEKHGLQVTGYCLMSNHVHLVATPKGEASLAMAVGRGHLRYTQYVNWRHRRSGHLWQNRFYSCALDERHAVVALRYVERNPVEAGLVAQPWQYRWSSAAAHVGDPDPTGLLDLQAWWACWSADEWREFVQTPEDESVASKLRSSTAGGWPLGTENFVRELERAVGCRVRPLPSGRPGKRRN